MAGIDPTARIERGAQIGADVEIGAYCVIGAKVTIGDGCWLAPHVVVSGRTTIGAGTSIGSFTSLGTPPQSVHYKGEDTTLVIGSNCDIREHVTINLGTGAGRATTVVGSHCMLMTGSHVAHDCIVANSVIFANHATLGGFCEVGEHVFLGGLCAVHQYTRIGEQAMICGLVGVAADVIPYTIVDGQRGKLAGLNRVGLRRRGFSDAAIREIFRGYRSIFFGPSDLKTRIEQTRASFVDSVHVLRMVEFASAAASRRLMLPRSGSRRET